MIYFHLLNFQTSNSFEFKKIFLTFAHSFKVFHTLRVPAGLSFGFGFIGFEQNDKRSGSGSTGLLKMAKNPSGFRVWVNPIHRY